MELFKKILIANRGEIAVRVIRAARSLGILSVAVYSEADSEAFHVRLADESYLLEGKELSETYLNIDKIIQYAKVSACEAIHPGYGFLSENPLLVDACEKSGLVFIGPNTRAIELMGNKIASRAFVKKLGIPMTDGLTGSMGTLLKKAADLGFPVLVKAAAGGGGKGMRIVYEEDKLKEVLESTSREAKSYFGDGTVYLERYIEEPRHIEIQVLGDKFGNVIHLYERECSIQRRYQKIIEESPSATLDTETRALMGEAAVKIARKIGYDSAGTVEFLVDKNLNFYFLEMNTRIQVEHTVTELVTGIDILVEQIKIAAGGKLNFTQKEIRQKGHAIECRIYAEDPENDFMPSPGVMSLYLEPKGEGIRVDSGTDKESKVESFYDPMIAKLISYGKTREHARKKMMEALQGYVIQGIKTNILYLTYLLKTSAFRQNKISTMFCDEHTQTIIETFRNEKEKVPAFLPLSGGLIYDLLKNKVQNTEESVWQKIGYWRPFMEPKVRFDDHDFTVNISRVGKDKAEFIIDDKKLFISNISIKNGSITLEINKAFYELFISETKSGNGFISYQGFLYQFKRLDVLSCNENYNKISGNGEKQGDIASPMPGKVIKIEIKKGDMVAHGDTLAIVEAMKMENHINAPFDGVIREVAVKEGDMVDGGVILMSME